MHIEPLELEAKKIGSSSVGFLIPSHICNKYKLEVGKIYLIVIYEVIQ